MAKCVMADSTDASMTHMIYSRGSYPGNHANTTSSVSRVHALMMRRYARGYRCRPNVNKTRNAEMGYTAADLVNNVNNSATLNKLVQEIKNAQTQWPVPTTCALSTVASLMENPLTIVSLAKVAMSKK